MRRRRKGEFLPVDLSGAVVSDPNARIVSRSQVGGYERLTITGGVSGPTAEAGYSLIVPLLSPSGRHLSWSQVWSCQIRLRHDTATAPAMTSGLYITASLSGHASTLVNQHYLGTGYRFTTSTILLEQVHGSGAGGTAAASGSSTAIVATVTPFTTVMDDTANRSRVYAAFTSASNISAQRVAINVANGVGTIQPTGLAYLALTVGRMDTTAGNAAIDVALDILTSEPADSWLAVA